MACRSCLLAVSGILVYLGALLARVHRDRRRGVLDHPTHHERVPHEAVIGIIYVTASAGGLVLANRFARLPARDDLDH